MVDVDGVVSLDLLVGIGRMGPDGCRVLLLNRLFKNGVGFEGVEGDVDIEGGEAEEGCERDANTEEDD